jgi:hypothetical protein
MQELAAAHGADGLQDSAQARAAGGIRAIDTVCPPTSAAASVLLAEPAPASCFSDLEVGRMVIVSRAWLMGYCIASRSQWSLRYLQQATRG